MNSTYDSILKLYVSGDDNIVYSKPFIVDDIVCATNLYELVYFDKSLSDVTTVCDKDLSKNIKIIIDKKENMSFDLDIDVIGTALKNVPLVDVMKRVGEDVTCSECGGDGIVEWEYSTWRKEMDCPKCKGDGYQECSSLVKSGEMVADKKYLFKIKNSRFSAESIERLLKVKNILNETKITMVYQDMNTDKSIFRIGTVTIVCMPILETEDDIIISYTY